MIFLSRSLCRCPAPALIREPEKVSNFFFFFSRPISYTRTAARLCIAVTSVECTDDSWKRSNNEPRRGAIETTTVSRVLKLLVIFTPTELRGVLSSRCPPPISRLGPVPRSLTRCRDCTFHGIAFGRCERFFAGAFI